MESLLVKESQILSNVWKSWTLTKVLAMLAIPSFLILFCYQILTWIIIFFPPYMCAFIWVFVDHSKKIKKIKNKVISISISIGMIIIWMIKLFQYYNTCPPCISWWRFKVHMYLSKKKKFRCSQQRPPKHDYVLF